MAEGTAEVTATTAAEFALEHIERLTSRPILGVTAIHPLDDGWLVEVEVVEERRVPSTTDILGLYEVEEDLQGGLLAYRRTRRYTRGSAE